MCPLKMNKTKNKKLTWQQVLMISSSSASAGQTLPFAENFHYLFICSTYYICTNEPRCWHEDSTVWVSCAIAANLWDAGPCPLLETLFNHFLLSLAPVRNVASAAPSCLKHLGPSVGKCQQITFCQRLKHLSAPEFLCSVCACLSCSAAFAPEFPPRIFFKPR